MILIVAIIWAVLYIWTVGALCAYLQHDCAFCTNDLARIAEFQRREFRGDLIAACLWALIPQVLLISPFLTGFYVNGWRIRPPRVPRG